MLSPLVADTSESIYTWSTGWAVIYELFSQNNGVVFLTLDASVTKHNFSFFTLSFWCSNLADFRKFSLVLIGILRANNFSIHQKVFCDTYTQEQKKNTTPFSGKYFVSDDPPYCTLSAVQSM